MRKLKQKTRYYYYITDNNKVACNAKRRNNRYIKHYLKLKAQGKAFSHRHEADATLKELTKLNKAVEQTTNDTFTFAPLPKHTEVKTLYGVAYENGKLKPKELKELRKKLVRLPKLIKKSAVTVGNDTGIITVKPNEGAKPNVLRGVFILFTYAFLAFALYTKGASLGDIAFLTACFTLYFAVVSR